MKAVGRPPNICLLVGDWVAVSGILCVSWLAASALACRLDGVRGLQFASRRAVVYSLDLIVGTTVHLTLLVMSQAPRVSGFVYHRYAPR